MLSHRFSRRPPPSPSRFGPSSALVLSHLTAALVGFLLARRPSCARPRPRRRACRRPYTGARWRANARSTRSIVETPPARAELHTARGETAVIRDCCSHGATTRTCAARARAEGGTFELFRQRKYAMSRPTPAGRRVHRAGRERGRRGGASCARSRGSAATLTRSARSARPRTAAAACSTPSSPTAASSAREPCLPRADLKRRRACHAARRAAARAPGASSRRSSGSTIALAIMFLDAAGAGAGAPAAPAAPAAPHTEDHRVVGHH